MEIRRIRNFLQLRQLDVSFATGISVSRLSAAENGRRPLNGTERRVLEEFYRARLQMLADRKDHIALGSEPRR